MARRKPGRMRNGETFRNGCTQPKRTHERKALPTWLSLWESWRRSRLRGAACRRCQCEPATLVRNGCTQPKRTHERKALPTWLSLWESWRRSRLRGAACRRCQCEPATLVVVPHHWGSPDSLQGGGLGRPSPPSVRTGHLSQRERQGGVPPLAFTRRPVAADNYESATLAIDPHHWGSPGPLTITSLLPWR